MEFEMAYFKHHFSSSLFKIEQENSIAFTLMPIIFMLEEVRMFSHVSVLTAPPLKKKVGSFLIFYFPN